MSAASAAPAAAPGAVAARRSTEPLCAGLLFLAAAAYFLLAHRLGLEWVDNGMILYPSWRVAHGAVPYRDFSQLFGPALFAVHALLFRLFGEDLIVIRLWLVLLKAVCAVLVYLCARQLAPRPFALAAAALLVAVWGAPWWTFNTPYANHYALTLCLAGLWLFLVLPAPWPWRALVAGLCFGAAMTFKQTIGAFAAMTVALFLLGAAPVDAAPSAPAARGAARLLRLVVLAGAAALVALYLAPRNTAINVAVLATPFAALWSALALRELQSSPAPDGLMSAAVGVLAAGVGIALPWAIVGAYFAAHQALAALLANMVTDLPHRVRWFEPYPLPPPRTLVLVVALLAGLAALRGWRRGGRHLARVRLWAPVTAVAAVAYAVDWARDPGQGTAWYAEGFRLLLVLPPLVVWAMVGALLRGRDWRRAPALPLFGLFAAVSLLFLYPSSDGWHVFMALPASLPPLAWLAARWFAVEPANAARGRRTAAAALAAIAIFLAAPFAHALGSAWLAPPSGRGLARASHVDDRTPKFRAAAELVAHLGQRAGEPLLVASLEPILYFLADRPSALDADEFVLYLIAFGTIEDDDARALLPEARVRERLATLRPTIVELPGRALTNFRRVYPAATEDIRLRYRPTAAFDQYRVLEWSGE